MNSVIIDWIKAKLGNVLVLNYGRGLPDKKRILGEIPIYGSNGIVGYHNEASVGQPGIIIGRKGSGGRVHYSKRPFCPIDTAFYVTQEDTTLDLDFLYFLLLHVNLRKLVTGVGVPGLNREMAYQEIVLFPEHKDEQHRITRILSTILTAIEQQERMNDLTRELKSALMCTVFTHGLHGEVQKKTDLGLVPKSWTLSKIGDVAKLQSGGTPSRDNLNYWTGGTIPWVKTAEINYKVIETTEEFITEEGLNNSAAKILPKGTLLVAMYGQGITRGRVGILGLDAAFNQACAAITPIEDKPILSRFLYYFLEFHYNDLRELGHGANQRNLNIDLIKSFPLSYPEVDEQQIIIDSLWTFDRKLMLIKQKRDLLQELFRTLLHQLMTGQTRVNDIDLSVI